MLGVLYLCLCFTSGWVICTYAFPNLSNLTKASYGKKEINLSPYWLLLPSWFLTGTLALTWATYLIASLCAQTQIPLVIANAVIMPIAFFAFVFVYYLKYSKNKSSIINYLCADKRTRRLELLFLLSITLLACILMWTTFYAKGEKLYVGSSVFSDFSPHIGMIRSFSYGNNFPTQYSHFAGEDIKYHFMFQFLVGNLEFLKLRIDYAFNIPSILSFMSAFMMLYVLASKITGNLAAGFLSCLFFAFRSSKTLFTYLSQLPKGTNLIQNLIENTDFISDTPNEDWGLWNLNVYCNQRHLAFGLAVILLVILLFLPYLYEMFADLKKGTMNNLTKKEGNDKPLSFAKKLCINSKIIFFTKEGWFVENLRLSIATGLLLGSIAFFHGAALIGCLLVLFIIAILSRRRLEFLIVAIITVGLSLLQSHFFINNSVVSPKLLFGFIAENKTLFGVASYLERLLGILPFLLLAAFCFAKGVERYLIIAFTAPLVFAFTISLTTDVTVNHKYIMMSCILLGIFAASLVEKLLRQKGFALRLVGVGLTLTMIGTGIYDFTTVIKKNQNNAIVLDLDDSLTKWINEYSDAKDIFLTSNYSLNQVVLGGAMLYEGWQYYAWSAGYDTGYRDLMVKEMYEADTSKQLDTLIKENQIRFIVVEYDNRISQEYSVNEDNLKATYQCVYHEGEGETEFSIYDTQLLLE